MVTRAFAVPGSVPVTLFVTDDRGGTSSTSQKPHGRPAPWRPTRHFSVLPATPTHLVSAVLNGSGSTVGTGATITQYDWDFGDGTPTVSGSSAAVNHTWATAGSYPVILTVTDSLGRTDTQLSVVTVQ